MKTSIKQFKDYGYVGLRIELTNTDQLLIGQLLDSIKNAKKANEYQVSSNVEITKEDHQKLINLLSKFTTVKLEESLLFAEGDKLPEGSDNDIDPYRTKTRVLEAEN